MIEKPGLVMYDCRASVITSPDVVTTGAPFCPFWWPPFLAWEGNSPFSPRKELGVPDVPGVPGCPRGRVLLVIGTFSGSTESGSGKNRD